MIKRPGEGELSNVSAVTEAMLMDCRDSGDALNWESKAYVLWVKELSWDSGDKSPDSTAFPTSKGWISSSICNLDFPQFQIIA